MTTAIRRRRGTTTQHATFTGLEGEVTVDTTKKALVVHDGSTAGGIPVARDSTVVHTTGAETVAGVKTLSSNPVLDAGTANGVAYLNGSKVLTTGSALTFNGTNFGVGGTALEKFAVVGTTSSLNINPDSSGTAVMYAYMNSAYNPLRLDGLNQQFYISGAEQMRLTSTGLGIGTSSPGAKLDVAGGALAGGDATYRGDVVIRQVGSSVTSNGGLELKVDNAASGFGARIQSTFNGTSAYDLSFQLRNNSASWTQRMLLDASGNLGIGTSSPSRKLTVFGSDGVPFFNVNGYDVASWTGATLDFGGMTAAQWNTLRFFTSGTERARITSGGFFKASDNGTYIGSTGAYHELVSSTGSATAAVYIRNTNATSPAGIDLSYSATSPNGTGNTFLYCQDSTALRMSVRSNGGIANFSANDVNLSDRREKTNFAPAKSYLETICAIPVQTFNYIDQSEDDPGLTLGVVAQDVQAVAPELVMESNWGTEDNPKMRLSIYQTDLQYALMKALQELKAEFDAYKATHP